jgi:ABC-type glycerol-3-phosphate transport system permease component
MMLQRTGRTAPAALATPVCQEVQVNEPMMRASGLVVLSTLLPFLSLQRYNIKGILVGGVRG